MKTIVFIQDHRELFGELRQLRKLGLMSYRAADEWKERFNRARAQKSDSQKMFDIEFEVENYIDHNAEKFISMFDPNCYLYLSSLIQNA